MRADEQHPDTLLGEVDLSHQAIMIPHNLKPENVIINSFDV